MSKVVCNASDDFGQGGSGGVSSQNRSGNCQAKRVVKSGMQLLGRVRDVEEWGSCCPNLDGTVSEAAAALVGARATTVRAAASASVWRWSSLRALISPSLAPLASVA